MTYIQEASNRSWLTQLCSRDRSISALSVLWDIEDSKKASKVLVGMSTAHLKSSNTNDVIQIQIILHAKIYFQIIWNHVHWISLHLA